MPGILDIAPPEIVTERIEIRGGTIEVRALRQRELAALRFRFGAVDEQTALDAVAATIAAALGQLGNKEIEKAVYDNLTDEELAEVWNVVMRLTSPPSPLAESPAVAGRAGNGAATITPPPSNS